NELALLKDPAANLIQVEIEVDGTPAGTFHSDGALVATSTGSTGYTLSAGGPLLDPRTDGLLVLPLNAHNLASRALVVPGPSRVSLRVDEPTRLILDGAVSLELNGDRPVVCSLDGLRMKLVRVPGSAGFYEQLRQKLAGGTPLVREGRRW